MRQDDNDRMFDLRVVRRNIAAGRISKDDRSRFIAALPDATENICAAEEGGDDDGFDPSGSGIEPPGDASADVAGMAPIESAPEGEAALGAAQAYAPGPEAVAPAMAAPVIAPPAVAPAAAAPAVAPPVVAPAPAAPTEAANPEAATPAPGFGTPPADIPGGDNTPSGI